MTKQEIIKTVNKNLGYNFNNGVIPYITDKGADKLLALFNQELSKRLEQLYSEMDERMREEVAIEKRMGEKKAEKLLNQIEELTTGKCALRCPLVEQEKKEVAREIIIRFKSFLETQSKTVEKLSKSKSRYAIPKNCVECYEGSQENRIEELKRIAKEYGVEL